MRHHVFGPGNTNTHYSRKTITIITNADHNVILEFLFYVFSQCETVILVAVHVDTITTTSYANVFPENQVSTKRHHHDQTVSLLYKWKWELCFVISNLNF